MCSVAHDSHFSSVMQPVAEITLNSLALRKS
jgi:hypothetical protein